MTSKLEYLTKHARLEHLSDNSKKEREAERAKLEERRNEVERRARQRERFSRDPRKNVALKVENRRKFGWESWDIAESIPICEVDSGWKSGKKVGLVDVASLTAQCKQLRSGAVSLNDLLARQPNRTKGQASNAAWPELLAAASTWLVPIPTKHQGCSPPQKANESPCLCFRIHLYVCFGAAGNGA